MATKPTVKAESGTDRVLVQKWGKAAIEAGFTALPNVVFQHAKALGLSHLDQLLILNLASFWWKPGDRPWPSKQKLADALDVDASTVRRSIQKMEKKGYVKRIYKKAAVGDNLSNEYDLTGLVAAVGLLAAKELKAREKRAEEDSARKRTPKAFEIIKGGKE